jgi:hypothetical protein
MTKPFNTSMGASGSDMSTSGSEAGSTLDPFRSTDPLSSAAYGYDAPNSLDEGDDEGFTAKSAARSAAASATDGVKETARATADAVHRQASRLMDDVGHELNETGEAQKARGVEAIRGLARVIDGAADDLEQQSPVIAGVVKQAARGVESLSEQLSNRNVNDLVDSAVRLARAQPALFVGGSVVAGFALARFLRSSARGRAGRLDS